MRRNLTLYQKALYYRKNGYSYNLISQKLGLAKSTLSDWLREIPYKPNAEVLSRIKLAVLKSAEINHRKRINAIKTIKQSAKSELGPITKRDLWLVGIGLYIGEGSKLYESIKIINSDPGIIKLAIKWFENICGFTKKNFLPYVHIYPDISEKEAVNYWSKITGIPKRQFGKIQVDRRVNKSLKKRRKLQYGTLHLQTRSLGRKEFGRTLHRRIIGWIEALLEQTAKAGVV